MAKCPNCGSTLEIDASACSHCPALFGPNSTWYPVPESPTESVALLKLYPNAVAAPLQSKPLSIIQWLTIVGLLLPLMMVLTGAALGAVIPGCKVDEASGAYGCVLLGINLSGLISFLTWFGLVWLIIGFGAFMYLVLPIWAIVSLVKLVKRRRRSNDTDSGASPDESAKPKVRSPLDNSLLGTCPNCSAVISLAAEECFRCKALFGPNSTWKVLV